MEFFTPVDRMDPDERRSYLQEGLILDVTEQIWAAMAEKGISRKDLSVSLGTSPANISRLLNGSRNMTLRTLSDIVDALGCDIRVHLTDRESGEGWIPLVQEDGWAAPAPVTSGPVEAANDWTTMAKVHG